MKTDVEENNFFFYGILIDTVVPYLTSGIPEHTRANGQLSPVGH